MEGDVREGGDFDAVLFDMDGVLVDSEELIAHAVMTMFKECYHFDMPRDAFYPYVGGGENRFIGCPAAEHGLAIDIDFAKAHTYALYDKLAEQYITVFPGAPEYVRACRELGLKVALASAADYEKVLVNLRILGISADFFDAVVTGSEVERKKPFPDIYLKAASKLGVDPRRCLVVEDAVNGIIAGRAAGARCLGITTSFPEAKLREVGAGWCASNLGSAPLPTQLG